MNSDLKLQIEKYLSDELSDEERIAFEQLLLNNTELEEDVSLSRQLNLYLANNSDSENIPDNELTKKIREFLRSSEASDLKERLHYIHLEVTKKKRAVGKKSWIPIAAAAVIILLLGLFFFNKPSGSDIYNDYYNENDLPKLITRNGDGDPQEQGIVSFQQGKYDASILQFDNYFETSNDMNPSVYLYRGMAYLESGMLENAISDFDQLINSNHLDSSKGLWFKALAYLKTDDKKSAITVLDEISKDSNNFRYADAKQLLQKLE